MRRKLLPAGLALALMMLFVGTAAATHSWGNYHWARSVNPLQLDIGSNVSSDYAGNLSTAVSDWTRTASESQVPSHWDGKSTWKNRPL